MSKLLVQKNGVPSSESEERDSEDDCEPSKIKAHRIVKIGRKNVGGTKNTSGFTLEVDLTSVSGNYNSYHYLDADLADVLQDKRDLVVDYAKLHGCPLMKKHIASVLKTEVHALFPEDWVARTEVVVAPTETTDDRGLEEHCELSHRNVEFTNIDMASECNSNGCLFGTYCHGTCGNRFGSRRGEDVIVPSVSAPVWVCKNLKTKNGCKWAVCNTCFNSNSVNHSLA